MMQYVNEETGLIIPMVAKIEWTAKLDKEVKITISENPELFMKPNQIKVHWKTGVKFIKNVYSISGEKYEAEVHTYDAFSNSENFFDSVVFTERKKQEALRVAIKQLNKAFYSRNNANKAIGEMENSWDDDSEPEAITELKDRRDKAAAYIEYTSARIHSLSKQYSSTGEEITINQLREEFWDTAIEKFYSGIFNKDVYEDVPTYVSDEKDEDAIVPAMPEDFGLTEVEVEEEPEVNEEEDDEFGPVESPAEEEVEEMEIKLTPSEAEEALGEL